MSEEQQQQEAGLPWHSVYYQSYAILLLGIGVGFYKTWKVSKSFPALNDMTLKETTRCAFTLLGYNSAAYAGSIGLAMGYFNVMANDEDRKFVQKRLSVNANVNKGGDMQMRSIDEFRKSRGMKPRIVLANDPEELKIESSENIADE